MIAYAYCCTSNLHPVFLESMKIQASMFPDVVQGEVHLVTDAPLRTPTDFPVTTCVFKDLWDGPNFRVGKAKNVSIDFALERGADYLVTMDADGVVTKHPSIYPESGMGRPLMRFQKHPEPIEATMKRPPLHPHWFMLSRDVIQKVRYCEDYVGYGDDDTDYEFNCLGRAGIAAAHTDMELLHRWHPPRDYSASPDNKLLLKKRGEESRLLWEQQSKGL